MANFAKQTIFSPNRTSIKTQKVIKDKLKVFNILKLSYSLPAITVLGYINCLICSTKYYFNIL